MMHDIVAKTKDFLMAERKVKFAYLFGSMANGSTGPLSDLDIAVYLDGRLNSFTAKLHLMEALAKKLASEQFDLVVLNQAPVVLQFEVIKHGKVLKEDKPRRITFETQVLRAYLDYGYLRQVQHESLKQGLRRQAAHG
jgi:predicted nucleotidyltransferase